jgi:hypothetical protein
MVQVARCRDAQHRAAAALRLARTRRTTWWRVAVAFVQDASDLRIHAVSMNHALPSLALCLLLQACVQAASPSPSSAVAAASMRCSPQTLSRLYFGLDSPQGEVSEAVWQGFVAQEIVPRLPAGFTLLAARGQWRGSDGVVRAEDSRVIEVVGDDDPALRQSLAEIVGRYKLRFAQESVLVTQSPTRACW